MGAAAGVGAGGVLYAAIPVEGGLRAGLSLAAAGDMAPDRRAELPCRSRLVTALGVAPDRVRAVRQVHSRTVVRVDGTEGADAPFAEADGMVTDRPGLLLTVTVADCLPIFLVDRRTGAFGLVHSGWKGTGIAAEALRAMASAFGSRAADVAATIGPGIGPCCYAVDLPRWEAFRAEYGDRAVQRGLDGSFRLDLRAANVGLLERAGVGRVEVMADCTACNPRLGSFRREAAGGPDPRAFTRMLAFIGGEPGGAGRG